MMLALSFLFPAILYAAGAAAAPVIIHMILRTKPRRVVFPALRFVRKTHQANLSKLRLKHIILLAMRMAAIAILALMIARPEVLSSRVVEDHSAPVAAVIVIDNSGSMNYRQAGASSLARAKEMAIRLISSLPPGSRAVVLNTSAPNTSASFLADPKLLAQQVTDVAAGFGHNEASAAMTAAGALLAASDINGKEVYLFTDLTARAWGEGWSARSDDKVSYYVIQTGCQEDSNVALSVPALTSPSAPQNAVVTLTAQVSSASVGGEMNVVTEFDGRAIDQRTVHLSGGSASGFEVPIKCDRTGVMHGKLTLNHPDGLDMDNTRYFTIQVGPLPKVLAAGGRTGDETYYLTSVAIKGRWIELETAAPESIDAAKLAGAKVLLLANAASLTETQWTAVGDFVRAGGNLWVVAGPMMAIDSYNSPAAQRLMPTPLKGLQELAKPIAFQAAPAGEEMLEPFFGPGRPSLAEVLCKGRFALQAPADDAHIVLKYADAVPAICTRHVGAGLVTFWNFSPAEAYFDRAGLAQFALLCQRTVRLLVRDASAQTMLLWGQSAQVPLPPQMKTPVITVRKPGDTGESPLAPDHRIAAAVVPADRLGAYTVQFVEGEQKVDRGFSVNADGLESDLRPIDRAKLTAMFPEDKLTVAQDVGELANRRKAVSQPLDLAGPLLLVLLALATAESFFANRFYKRTVVTGQDDIDLSADRIAAQSAAASAMAPPPAPPPQPAAVERPEILD